MKNFEKWKDSVSYGYRWITETIFSSVKRTFGEYVSARKYSNMVKEMMLKASLYNMFIIRKIAKITTTYVGYELCNNALYIYN